MPIWKKTRKGNADIYAAEGVSFAIVDRRGIGVAAAMGANVTFDGQDFESVDTAKAFVAKRFSEEGAE